MSEPAETCGARWHAEFWRLSGFLTWSFRPGKRTIFHTMSHALPLLHRVFSFRPAAESSGRDVRD